jgi:hypothetical protein
VLSTQYPVVSLNVHLPFRNFVCPRLPLSNVTAEKRLPLKLITISEPCNHAPLSDPPPSNVWKTLSLHPLECVQRAQRNILLGRTINIRGSVFIFAYSLTYLFGSLALLIGTIEETD